VRVFVDEKGVCDPPVQFLLKTLFCRAELSSCGISRPIVTMELQFRRNLEV
jgi:hypothetical protein